MLGEIDRAMLRHVTPLPPDLIAGDKIQPGHPYFGLVWINPTRVSGTPCFYGTRVPLKNLFDTLTGGGTVDDFLDGFDGVTREQALASLELATRDLLHELESM